MVRTRKISSKNISIEDVARISGVSVTTVSRVINKFPSVKEKNRVKVLDAVKKLKYQPSIFAQRLATGKSNVIALVIPHYEGLFYSFYALELIRGIGTLCEALNLDLLLQISSSAHTAGLRGTGGIIFADLIGNRAKLENALIEGTPSVVINNKVEDLLVSSVSVDNEAGAKAAVDYLINMGHSKVAHISGDLITQAAAQRLSGYEHSLTEKGMQINKDYIKKTDYSRGQARQATEELLSLPEPPTAIFVASDSMALEVMAVAREKGKEIPKDLSIIGFDDNPSGLYGPVALTTVRQPLVKMAQEGVKLLHSIMKDKFAAVQIITLPTELVIRESTGPVRS